MVGLGQACFNVGMSSKTFMIFQPLYQWYLLCSKLLRYPIVYGIKSKVLILFFQIVCLLALSYICENSNFIHSLAKHQFHLFKMQGVLVTFTSHLKN